MTKKIRKILISVICMMICTGMISTSAFAAGKAKKINDYRCWAQDDPRWAAVKLGKSGLTVSDAGCAVVSYTKLLIQAGVKNKSFTPDQLVKWMKKNGKFNTKKGKRAQIGSWKEMADISSKISYVSIEKKPSAKTVMSYVRKGNFVILKVTLKGGGDHFVTVANDASISARKPLIWNSVKGVSRSKKLYQKYNLNKNPYKAFKSVDRAIVYRTKTAASVQASKTTASKPASVQASKTTASKPASVSSAPLELKNAFLPQGSIARGSAFTISGMITSCSKIIETAVTVSDASGHEMFSASASPNANSFSLYTLDKNMAFSKLPAGSYTYCITAADETSCRRWNGSFHVQNTDIAGQNCTYPKGTLQKGKTFSCKGTLTSASPIRHVTMSVYSTDGVKQFAASADPNACRFDLHSLDSKMVFRTLPCGRYIYRVSATDSSGTVRNVISISFEVRS